eukprot:NODE_4328_length_351_cov_858.311258_g3728_i0.p1 GENE.NODE_4328_length_351_cov_858.311258_g3728_i0~~NODE_4328_length_351_cov_858.311258_g3728_i0.p1  ORF type:complete len:98 (+),score=20.22 NODE_4328_length_351_cov_858.311258_g3728_i0:28-294(+)
MGVERIPGAIHLHCVQEDYRHLVRKVRQLLCVHGKPTVCMRKHVRMTNMHLQGEHDDCITAFLIAAFWLPKVYLRYYSHLFVALDFRH